MKMSDVGNHSFERRPGSWIPLQSAVVEHFTEPINEQPSSQRSYPRGVHLQAPVIHHQQRISVLPQSTDEPYDNHSPLTNSLSLSGILQPILTAPFFTVSTAVPPMSDVPRLFNNLGTNEIVSPYVEMGNSVPVRCTPVHDGFHAHVASPVAEDPTMKPTVLYASPVGVPRAITPDGYRRADLPPKIARQFVSNYGIPEYPVYYFSQEDGSPHLCPIGECGQYFLGHTIRTHLQECHKYINSRNRDLIQCTSKSNESSRCSPENKVQGRYFEKHFREVHLDQHFLCPFCKGRQRRMSQFGEHFEKCKRLQWARDKRGTVIIE
ncbi:hypothetical protein EDD85DRAFT_117064 [Armillaria nabsnona]|nr:hypothetical protein EDD85DRAFT_117064 [Armillaria nabsnona]